MVETCLSNPAINCSFHILQYQGISVELNLVGAVLPLVASLVIVLSLRRRFRLRRVVIFAAISTLILTGVASLIEALYGGIATPGWSLYLVWFFIVLTFSRLRFDPRNVLPTLGELYVIGTVSVFLEDALRTTLGFLYVPVLGLRIEPSIWGGAGPMDGIFLAGLYQVLFYAAIFVVLASWRGRGKLDAANSTLEPES